MAKLDINDDYVCVSNILNCEVHYKRENVRKPIEGETYNQYVGFEWADGPNSSYTFSYYLRVKYKYSEFTEEELLKNNNLTKIRGYYGYREFYRPNHEEGDDPFPDYRNTLLWAPEIITDKNGEAMVEFFFSDINTHFIGTVEGVGGQNLLGKSEFVFFVSKKGSE